MGSKSQNGQVLGESKVLPLHEHDIDNLNNYFGQTTLADRLDKDPAMLLRLNEMEQVHQLNSQAIYNLLVNHTYESLDTLKTSGENIMSMGGYGVLCEALKDEAKGSKLDVTAYCEINAHKSPVKDILAEMGAIKKDSSYSQAFSDFQENYADFKSDLNVIYEHVAQVIESSGEDYKANLVDSYTKTSNEFKVGFNETLGGLYLNLNQNDQIINLQNDFKHFMQNNENTLKGVKSHDHKLLHDNSHSIDNTV